MSEIEKLDLTSMNVKEEQIAKLKQLFPEAFTEGDKVDWDKLKLTLGENIDVGKERYGMNWPGKADCFKAIQQQSTATLVPDREESVNFDTTENLFIEGDNLEVLKLLQKSYLSKIKMIYIDPPYNTGNDFIYPDNYSESLDTYLEYTGQVDSEGKKFSTNTDIDGRFHSKWMNMMYPRLFLAKNLLNDEGIIFISIDDNEVKNLRSLCDEIFGEENFIAQLIWKSRQNKDNRNISGVSNDHEYIICYAKHSIEKIIRGDQRKVEQYKNPDNDPRGPWVSGNMVGILPQNLRPNCHYDLINPRTTINYGKPRLGWRYDKTSMNKLINENRIIWPDSKEGRPRKKTFLYELKSEFTGFSSIIGENIYTRDGTADVNDLFEFKVFDFPKPCLLIEELLVQGSESDDIILDFFAGSATTAHAVFEVNKIQDSNRKFIIVQLPEPTDVKSESNKAGYKTIADIGKERIKRVITNLLAEEEPNQSETIDPKLFETDQQPQKQKKDLGFKVLKLTKSNFSSWDVTVEKNPEAIQEQLFKHVQHISPEAEQEAILYELLLKSGFELTTPIKKLELENKHVFSVGENELLICLEKQLTHEVIKAMAELKPIRIICLDEGFQNNDQLKTNAALIMKTNGVEKFQTV